MILTTHVLIGAALGKNISNPWLVAIIAIPLHFIMDHFRHGEYIESTGKKTGAKNVWWKIVLDLIVATTITSAIIISAVSYSGHFSSAIIQSMLIGIFFSIFPDFLTLLYWEFRWPVLKPLHDFHVWCHKYPPFSKERGWNLRNARNDILFSVIAIILLLI
jgi:hypothetical protein